MIFIAGLGAFALAVLATRLYLPLAARIALVDTPNARSAHHRDTPSSGGIALVASLLCVLTPILVLGDIRAGGAFYSMLFGLVLVCVTGAVDDWRPLPVLARLLVFAMAASVAVVMYWPATWSDYRALLPVMVLALVWLYNLYNFMDGIDGLAALQTLLCALGLAACGFLGQAPDAFLVLAAAVAGVYAGFLCFNWPPARLFMGDAGSLSAGFLLGWLGLWGLRDGFLSPVSWILLMSPFLLDATVTLARRAWRRERITQGHSQHLYQRLNRHFGSPSRVVFGLLVMHLGWLLPLALMHSVFQASFWTFICLGLFPQLFLIAKHWRLQ